MERENNLHEEKEELIQTIEDHSNDKENEGIEADKEEKELLENLKDPLFVNYNFLGRLEEIRNILFELLEIKKAESKIDNVFEKEEMEGIIK